MADGLEVKLDEKSLERIRKLLREVPNAMPKIMYRGLSRTATSVRADIARRISEEVKITQASVKKGIKVVKPTYTRWQADLILVTSRIPLIQFRAKQLKKGVSYIISKSGGRKKITDPARPFIQTMKSGHVGVFRRWRPATHKLPIYQLYGPSMAGVFESPARINEEIQDSAGRLLEKNLTKQVEYVLIKKSTS